MYSLTVTSAQIYLINRRMASEMKCPVPIKTYYSILAFNTVLEKIPSFT